MTAEAIITKLNLIKHPEGGFYKETYRCEQPVVLNNKKERSTGTAIYYLLKDIEKSHFHKIGSDELWLFHQGEPLEIFMITDDGQLETKTLGNRFELGEEPQFVIKANIWFAAKVKSEKGFSLVSCIVTPGFDFSDFELANKNELLKTYPHLKIPIEELCL